MGSGIASEMASLAITWRWHGGLVDNKNDVMMMMMMMMMMRRTGCLLMSNSYVLHEPMPTSTCHSACATGVTRAVPLRVWSCQSVFAYFCLSVLVVFCQSVSIGVCLWVFIDFCLTFWDCFCLSFGVVFASRLWSVLACRFLRLFLQVGFCVRVLSVHVLRCVYCKYYLRDPRTWSRIYSFSKT